MKIKFNADRIVAVSAMVISLITLLIFSYQTSIIREQSRLSVKPRLTFSKNISRNITQIDSNITVEITIQLRVKNNGLGPAIIEGAKYVDKGKSYNMMTFFKDAYPKLEEFGHFSQITDLTVGEAIPEKETIELFSYKLNGDDEDKVLQYFNLDGNYEFPFHVEITYSSMYEEKWKVKSNVDNHPEVVD